MLKAVSSKSSLPSQSQVKTKDGQLEALVKARPGVLKKLVLGVPLLFYAYVYFGLRWLNSEFLPLIKNPLGLLLLLLMSASFGWRAWQAKKVSLKLILLAAALLFFGLTVSLLTRQAEVFTAKEGEQKIFGTQNIELKAVKTVNRPNFFFSRDQLAAVKAGKEQFQFGVFPLRRGSTFWHTTQFGFAPYITVTNSQGYPEFNDSLYFGLNPIDPRYSKLIPRRPPPRLMLGVGTYPPELEGMFTLPYANQVYFLRLEKGTFKGKAYDLMRPDYYLWLTNGRLTKPVYRLMVWHDSKPVFNRLIKPGQTVKIGDRWLKIGQLDYWVEVSQVKDYGLPLILTAFILALTGFSLAVLSCLRTLSMGKSSQS